MARGRFPPLVVALAVLASGCAGEERLEPLAYACTDIVVTGRLSDQKTGETVEIEGDLLGHGWFSARLTVERQLAGRAAPRRLNVRYFGHAHLRGDRDFLFVLRRTAAGLYEIDATGLISDRPRLAARCNREDRT